MYRIEPVRKNYAWGSTQRLQSLFHLDEPGPLAELWFSGHPESPSVLDVDGDRINLAEAIDRAPEFMLGHEVVQRWGGLPAFPFQNHLRPSALVFAGASFAGPGEGRLRQGERVGPGPVGPLPDFQRPCGQA